MDTASLRNPNDVVATAGGKAATVLALVVQHCSNINSDRKTLCALTQVSTACRTALQQCTAHIDISLRGPTALAASCSAWLSYYPGLVDTLQFQHTGPGAQEAYRLLCTGLCAAAGLAPALPAPGAGAASAPASLLHLTRCVLDTPGALCDDPTLGPALACATTLQHLSLGSGRRAASIGSALAHLTRLTSLRVDAVVDSACVSTLPASLRELGLAVDVFGAHLQGVPGSTAGPNSSDSNTMVPNLDFGRLSALRALHLNVCDGSSSGRPARGEDGWASLEHGVFVQLPLQLRELRAAGAVQGFGIGVENGVGEVMESCELSVSSLHPTVVCELLARLPNLGSLALAAQLDLPVYEPAFQELQVASQLRGVATALRTAPTSLTSLAVLGYRPSGIPLQPQQLLATMLIRFHNLRQLRWGLRFGAGSIPFLGSLPLTQLHLYRSDIDQDCLELLCEDMHDLVDLEVSGSRLSDCRAVFMAVSGLIHLRRLSLGRNSQLQPTASDLRYLVPPETEYGEEPGLSQLTYLCLPAPAGGLTQEELAAFAAQMPSLRELTVA